MISRRRNQLSRTAWGLPGRLIIKLFFLVPAQARERTAVAVCSYPFILSISARPGTSFSITWAVTSGVMSRGPSPVPPEVRMRSTTDESASSRRALLSWSSSSGRTSSFSTFHPSPSTSSFNAGPLLSSRSPRAALSLRTIIPTRIVIMSNS